MKTRLMELLDDEDFAVDALSFNNGIMLYKASIPVDFMILEYKKRFEVYLNLYDDEDEPPYRNILVKGSAKKLEIAQKIAVRKLEKELNNYVH